MRRFIRTLIAPAGLLGGLCAGIGGAAAQSPQYMLEDCRLASQQFYKDYGARSEASYEGQRTNGTHAVNGTIQLKDRSAYFSCSYNAAGTRLVEFFAEQKSQPGFVRGAGGPSRAGAGAATAAAPKQRITTELVRFLAGQTSQTIPAQLPGGMTVRYMVRAKKNQFLTVSVSPPGAPVTYRIVNPNGRPLLDEMSVDRPYRGQLWQTGRHVVEVINRGASPAPFQISFGLE